MQEILWDALIDSVKLIPFLFFTYLAMEYLEHKAGEKTISLVQKTGKWGPFFGGILGAAPQCGFSVAASGLYAGRVITLGTLIAIYLSTSDEMLPIMISRQQPLELIFSVLLAKVLIGMLAGFVIDMVHGRITGGKASPSGAEYNRRRYDMCEKECCNCEQGIFRSACRHTLQIAVFIFAITLGLQLVLYLMGEEALAGLVLNRPVLGPVLAGLVGLIPNCAASVAITELYLSGVIRIGTMMAGLLTGAGAGVLVLFRANKDKKENLKILSVLYGIGVFSGIVIDFVM